MDTGMKIGAAVVGGYILGRRRKAKLAIGLGGWLLGKKLNLDPKKLATQLGKEVQSSEQFGQLRNQLRDEVFTVGKTAAGNLIAAQTNRLADGLHSRTENLKGTANVIDAPQDEDDEPAASDEDESRDEDDSDREARPRKRTSSGRSTSAAQKSGPSKSSGRASSTTKKTTGSTTRSSSTQRTSGTSPKTAKTSSGTGASGKSTSTGSKKNTGQATGTKSKKSTTQARSRASGNAGRRSDRG